MPLPSRYPLALLLTAFGAGCLGGPDAESASAGLGLAPKYALRIDSTLTVQHSKPGSQPETPIEIRAAVRGILSTPPGSETGATPASFRLCRLDLPPVSGRQLVFDDRVWSLLEEQPVTLQPATEPGVWDLGPWAILMGVRGLADPVDDALPTDPNDPRVDRVEDANPGVRIGISVSGWSDPKIDATVRVRLPSGTAALAPDGRLVGQVELSHEVWVWYADMPWPVRDRNAAEANQYMRDKMAEWPILAQRHDLAGTPLDGAADCARALAVTGP